jgi:hypothetical protein
MLDLPDLLARGFQNITVLDISQSAINVSKARLGPLAQRVHWLAADITELSCRPQPTTSGMTGRSFISSRPRNSVSHMFGELRIRSEQAAM